MTRGDTVSIDRQLIAILGATRSAGTLARAIGPVALMWIGHETSIVRYHLATGSARPADDGLWRLLFGGAMMRLDGKGYRPGPPLTASLLERMR